MDILMISTFPPRRCGIGDYTADLVGHLGQTAGVSLRVLTYEDRTNKGQAGGIGFKVSRELKRTTTPRQLGHLLNEYGPDLVHLQSSSFLHHPSLSNAVTRGCPVPLVTTVHDVPSSWRLFYVIQSLRRVYKKSERLITHSQASSEILERFHEIPGEKIVQIPLGIDSQEYHPQVNGHEIRKRYGLGNSRIVLFFGFLRPGKGLRILVRAWHRIENRHPDALLVIAGGAPSLARRYSLLLRNESAYPGRLANLVRRLKMRDRVAFTNYVPEELLPELFADADLVVLPHTGSPMQSSALNKALSSAKAVVATRVPGFSELLRDGEDAVLVPPGSPTDLARAIEALLDNPERARSIGERAREKAVKHHDWSRIAERTLRVYEDALT